MIMCIPIFPLIAKLYWILAVVLGQIAPCLTRCIMLELILTPNELIMQSDYIATMHFKYLIVIIYHLIMSRSTTYLLSLYYTTFLRMKYLAT